MKIYLNDGKPKINISLRINTRINTIFNHLEIYIKYFYNSNNLIDNGLINIGKFLENFPTLNLITFYFGI